VEIPTPAFCSIIIEHYGRERYVGHCSTNGVKKGWLDED
jgi:hypothetical protein